MLRERIKQMDLKEKGLSLLKKMGYTETIKQ